MCEFVGDESHSYDHHYAKLSKTNHCMQFLTVCCGRGAENAGVEDAGAIWKAVVKILQTVLYDDWRFALAFSYTIIIFIVSKHDA